MALKVILNKEQEHVQSIRLLRASAQTDLEYFQGRGIPVLTHTHTHTPPVKIMELERCFPPSGMVIGTLGSGV